MTHGVKWRLCIAGALSAAASPLPLLRPPPAAGLESARDPAVAEPLTPPARDQSSPSR